MLFRSFVLAALAAVSSANQMIPTEGIPATSRIGARLMAKAVPIEGEFSTPRELENNQNDNTWMVGFSIKYLSCASLIQMGGQQGGNNNNHNNNGQSSSLYTQHVVKFALCPSESSCSSCNGSEGAYAVNMADFLQAWVEMKQQELQTKCETVRNNCYCENVNDDQVCETQCYYDAGLTECGNQNGQQNGQNGQNGQNMDYNRWMECAQFENKNGNNNNNQNNNNQNNANYYQTYYSGMYCDASDGKSIHFALFTDSGCTTKAPTGTYETLSYGYTLPYETTSIVDHECVSCAEEEENNNNNNQNNNNNNYYNQYNNGYYYNNNYKVLDVCEQAYYRAAKCEQALTTGSSYFYPDTSGCSYINSILPNYKAASRSSHASYERSGGAATAFAIIFALSTVILGLYAFFLYRKIHRAKVTLSSADGSIA